MNIVRKTIGYTTGVFDLFHIGHLNILKSAKEHCDVLIVGVTTDEISVQMKNKKPVIPFDERIAIVDSIKYVDKVVAKDTVDNLVAWNKLKFNVYFKGNDWENTKKGRDLEKMFNDVGVSIVYFPYTVTTSSTEIRKVLNHIV